MPPAGCRLGNPDGEAFSEKPRVTPILAAVYEELQSRASSPQLRDRSRDACEAFLRRTSSSARAQPSPPEARVRAAWDDALTQGGLAAELAPSFEDASERALARAIARAHRSTFAILTAGSHRIVRDVIAGGEFVVLQRDDIARGVLAVESDEPLLFEARIVAASDGCAIMPGILFHPTAATPLIRQILHSSEARQLSRHALCDALLRMLHTFETLARVKIGYAYKVEALPQPATSAERHSAGDGRPPVLG
jgi:hypothetical protein